MGASTTTIVYPGNIGGAALGILTPQTPLVLPVPTPGTPVQFTATAKTFASRMTVTAVKTGRVANATDVFIGPVAAALGQVIKLATGTSYVFIAPEGAKFDLSLWYVDALTAADGVVVYWSI